MSQVINGFNAVRFFVSDLNRAVDFYGNTLGLQLSAHEESLYAVFQLPNVTVLVERVDPDDPEFKELVGRFTAVSFSTGDIVPLMIVYLRLVSGLKDRQKSSSGAGHWCTFMIRTIT